MLVLDFVNQAKDVKSDYLSVSVAEAMLDPLKKTGKFYLLPRTSDGHTSTSSVSGSSALSLSKGTFDESEAIQRAKAAGADVVVVGIYVTVGDKVMIQTKALDVHTGQMAVAKTASGQLDATVFDLIQNLANGMSAAMASALPPLPRQIVVTQKIGSGFYAKDFQAHAFAGAALALGKPNPYLSAGFGASADLKFEFLHPYFQPYFYMGANFTGGQKAVESMSLFTLAGGASYAFALPVKTAFVRSVGVTPFLALGSTFGSIRAASDLIAENFSYSVFTFSMGASLDAYITDVWSAALSLRMDYLAESQTPLPIISIQLGVGYRL